MWRIAAIITCLAACSLCASAGGGDDTLATLVVRNVGLDGSPIEVRRYVALLHPRTPWSQPIDERILDADGKDVTFQVPAGAYRALCAAEGLAPDETRVVETSAGETREIVCRHAAVGSLIGVVVSARDGVPVAGAKVGMARMLAGGTVFASTSLAEPLLVRPLWTTTDARGRFELRLPVVGKTALWVEAQGFAPHFQPNVMWGEALPALALKPGGGSLEVRIAADPGACVGCAVELLPGGVTAGEGFRSLPPYLLRLQLNASGVARWPSLPDGVYGVGLRRDLVAGGAQTIAQVWVGGGHSGRLERRLDASSAVSDTPPPPKVRLVIPNAETSPPRVEASVWKAGLAAPVEISWREGREGLVGDVEGVCGSERFVVISDSPRRVGGVSAQELCTSSAPVSVQVFAAATLAGRLRVPAALEMPAWGWLQISSCGRGPQVVPLAVIPFSVNTGGEWETAIPSGCTVTTLLSPGFAPARLAERTVEQGGRSHVGNVDLAPGGAITARLVDGRDGSTVAGARVSAITEEKVAEEVKTSLRGREAVRGEGERSDASGWIRLPAVAAGRVVLRIDRSGRLSVFSGPIEVRAGEELVIDPLEIAAAGSLRVAVRDRRQTQAPALVVTAAAEEGAAGVYAGTVLTADVDKAGAAEFAELPPGVWRVNVLAKSETGVAILARERVLVQPGEELTIEMEVEPLVFRGRVVHRDQPVRGVLDVRPTSAAHPTRSSVRCDTDEQGRFEIALAATGLYDVRVQRANGEEWKVGLVTIEDPEKELLIRVPGGSLQGTVVDEKGRPVEGASVSAYLPAPIEGRAPGRTDNLAVKTGTDGNFSIESMRPGNWTLIARRDELLSARVAFEQVGEAETSGLQLVLTQARLRLTLQDSGGRPVQAQGLCVVAPSAAAVSAMHFRYSWSSDANGVVTLSLAAADAEHVRGVGAVLLGSQQSGTAFAVRQPLRDGQVVVLDAQRGNLTLVLPAQFTQGKVSWVDLSLVRDDGAFIPLRYLTERGHLKSLARMSPGASSPAIPIGPVSAGAWSVVLARSWTDLYLLANGHGLALKELGRVLIRSEQSSSLTLEWGLDD